MGDLEVGGRAWTVAIALAGLASDMAGVPDAAQQGIALDARPYPEGLQLDALDILEVALVVSKRYGFKLREDDQDNVRIFSSLRNLARTVSERRTK